MNFWIVKAGALGLSLAAAAGMFSLRTTAAEDDDRPAANASSGPDAAQFRETRRAGIDFLRTTQADDGSWTSPNAPGITGLIVTALLQSGLPADDPTVAKGLTHLESHIKPDGGVYFEKSNHRN